MRGRGLCSYWLTDVTVDRCLCLFLIDTVQVLTIYVVTDAAHRTKVKTPAGPSKLSFKKLSRFSDPQVVLIHSRNSLADAGLLPSVRQQAKEVLLEKGVELLLGTNASLTPADRVLFRPGSVQTGFCQGLTDLLCVVGQKVSDMSELQLNVTQKNTVVTTDKGERLTTDLIICCAGLRVNSAAYASSFCESRSCLLCAGSRRLSYPSLSVHRVTSLVELQEQSHKLE